MRSLCGGDLCDLRTAATRLCARCAAGRRRRRRAGLRRASTRCRCGRRCWTSSRPTWSLLKGSASWTRRRTRRLLVGEGVFKRLSRRSWSPPRCAAAPAVNPQSTSQRPHHDSYAVYRLREAARLRRASALGGVREIGPKTHQTHFFTHECVSRHRVAQAPRGRQTRRGGAAESTRAPDPPRWRRGVDAEPWDAAMPGA